MINNTFDLLWRDISPFTIGFDRTFDTLSLLANSKQQSSNYPPYNIRKVSEDKYTIELALAGFEEKEIDIEAAGENLTIKGSKAKDASEGIFGFLLIISRDKSFIESIIALNSELSFPGFSSG